MLLISVKDQGNQDACNFIAIFAKCAKINEASVAYKKKNTKKLRILKL